MSLRPLTVPWPFVVTITLPSFTTSMLWKMSFSESTLDSMRSEPLDPLFPNAQSVTTTVWVFQVLEFDLVTVNAVF